MVNKGDRLIN